MSNQKRVNDGTNANDQYDDRLMINNPENITNGGPNPVKIHRSGNHQMEDSSESINFPESSGENDVGTSSTHYQLSIAETTNTTARLEPSDNEPCFGVFQDVITALLDVLVEIKLPWPTISQTICQAIADRLPGQP
ncbi:unnamed protein product [Caenorhabditis angaria]|uniref:Uncharacterized protein n=1 Tax=Caenorhabditis angaria TaxID=860376 RepID=A0A9P1J1J7_9PELO|nr:unnamed protein product [Caenorhabditis angaria]